jgi:ABC-2 type transport system ATP-binding protein
VTIVLTTHDMDEAAELTDRVGIVDRGKLLALDSPQALVRGLSGQSVLELTVVPGDGDGIDAVIGALVSIDGVDKAEPVRKGAPSFPGFPGGSPGGFPGFGGGGPGAGATRPASALTTVVPDGKAPVQLRIYLTADSATVLGPVVTALSARSATLTDVHIGQPSLEDVFIELTGRGLR